MSAVVERAAEVAPEILDELEPSGAELFDHSFVRTPLAAAYTRGFIEGRYESHDLDAVLDALRGIEALARVLTLDPAHQFDRTAIALVIEREAHRIAAILNDYEEQPKGENR